MAAGGSDRGPSGLCPSEFSDDLLVLYLRGPVSCISTAGGFCNRTDFPSRG